MMKTKTLSLLATTTLILGSFATAAPSKTYQVTGPVLEINDSMIAVQKGKERWEVAKDSTTKATGAIKVGDRVTIVSTMTATEIEVKADKAAKAEGRTSPSPTATEKK